MPETTDPIETPSTSTDPQQKLRVWPALLIAVLGFSISLYVAYFSSTNLENLTGLLGAPIMASALILIWWVFFSRAPWRTRFICLFVFILLLVAPYLTQKENPVFIIVAALPYMVYGAVAWLALTQCCSWKVQRTVTLVYLIACSGFFAAQKVESIAGDLNLELTWQWESSTSATTADSQSAKSPGKIAELPASLSTSDWPAFRGVNRDSHLPGVTFATDWDSTPPRELWRKTVGAGWSSFTVVGNYLFTQEQRGNNEVVICYAADTAEVIWINTVEALFDEVMGPGPRATPTYLDGKLYTQGATGIVQCIDATTGATIWQQDLTKDTEATVPTWGFASSPLVVGDTVIQYAGGNDESSVIAYDRNTGDVAWNKGHGKDGYSSAQLATLNGIPQVLINSNFGIQSFVPETGEVLWEHDWKAKSNPRVVQPLLTEDGGILIGTAGGQGTRRLSISATDAQWTVSEDWTTKKFRPYFNDFILHEGYCYGFDGNRPMCIDVKTGIPQWKGDRIGGQLLFVSDMAMLLILNEEGQVLLVNAQPDAYTIVAEFKAIEGKTWNHPVIANGILYVRNSDEMAAFELPKVQ